MRNGALVIKILHHMYIFHPVNCRGVNSIVERDLISIIYIPACDQAARSISCFVVEEVVNVVMVEVMMMMIKTRVKVQGSSSCWCRHVIS